MRVVGAVLAAGASRRLGRPKQLLELGGEPLVRRAVRMVVASSCSHASLVVGAHADDVVVAANAGSSVTVLRNEHWEEGIASSIRAAAKWAESLPCDGLLLALCDQPHLTTAHLDALLAVFALEKRNAGSAYAGVLGAPAVFDRAALRDLGRLEGDRGAGGLLLRGAGSVAWPAGISDIDTESDLSSVTWPSA